MPPSAPPREGGVERPIRENAFEIALFNEERGQAEACPGQAEACPTGISAKIFSVSESA
jgi:hypothetical protein